jgi:hypothetical protein
MSSWGKSSTKEGIAASYTYRDPLQKGRIRKELERQNKLERLKEVRQQETKFTRKKNAAHRSKLEQRALEKDMEANRVSAQKKLAQIERLREMKENLLREANLAKKAAGERARKEVRFQVNFRRKRGSGRKG